ASALSCQLAGSAGDFRFDEGGEVALKGLAGAHRVHPVLWDPDVSAYRGVGAAPTADSPSADGGLKREGGFWTIRYRGRSIRRKGARGLDYRGMRLGRQGEEVHVIDMAGGTQGDGGGFVGAEPGLEVSASLGDAGEVLDAKARREYRDRLESLRAELEEAQS